MQRVIAICIVVAPVLLSVYGIKQMRDTFFGYINSPYPTLWMQFVVGLLLFLFGLFLIGNFIFYRDKKRNKVQPKFTHREKP